METTEAEKDNKEKVVMDIMVTEKAVDIMAAVAKAVDIMMVEKAIMVAEKAIMVVMEKAVDIMMVEKAIMAVKATMVASDSIIAHPIAIGTT